MSLPISSLMNFLNENNNQPKELLGDKNPDIPNRYNDVKNIKNMTKRADKNHNSSPYEYDQFNQVMKQSRGKEYNISNLHWQLKQKQGTAQLFQEDDGWWEPGQRRRAEGDPNKAPPYDFVNGAHSQKFSTDETERVARNNVSLIQTAHKSFQNYVNRYNVPSIPVTILK